MALPPQVAGRCACPTRALTSILCVRRNPRAAVVVAAQNREALFKGCSAPAPGIKVVGCGSCGVDYLASVAAFPAPDEKLRTEQLEVQGGGNAANALTAAARLGLAPTIVTKIGGDTLGDGILEELQREGIDTTHVIRAKGSPSPFTYIIVDRAQGTRTCIHTPGAPLAPGELQQQQLDAILQGAALVYFDGRLTEAAIELAKRARAHGIPVLVEAERLRPNLEGLLALADYVVTSKHFPQDWTGEAELGDALIATALRLRNAKAVFTTLGSKGSILLRPSRLPDQGLRRDNDGGGEPLQLLLNQALDELAPRKLEAAANEGPVCISSRGVGIYGAVVKSWGGPRVLTYSSGWKARAAAANRQAAAERAASMNADAGSGSRYQAGADAAQTEAQDTPLVVDALSIATAATLAADEVVDTTGAGDAFIGSVIYTLATGMPYERALHLGAAVAACKCTELGARPGLPHRTELAHSLLHSDSSLGVEGGEGGGSGT